MEIQWNNRYKYVANAGFNSEILSLGKLETLMCGSTQSTIVNSNFVGIIEKCTPWSRILVREGVGITTHMKLPRILKHFQGKIYIVFTVLLRILCHKMTPHSPCARSCDAQSRFLVGNVSKVLEASFMQCFIVLSQLDFSKNPNRLFILLATE